jgi:hypothetical protein
VNLARLRQVAGHDGPFASVYFDSSHDTEDAAHQLDLRWRSIREQLTSAGASRKTVAALDTAIVDGPASTGRAGRALLAAEGTVLLDEQLSDPPPAEIVRFSPLPYLLPVLELGPRQVPHVVAVIDRVGADLRAVGADGAELTERSVRGEEHPVHKVRGGGWAYWNIQHRVEDVVRRNVERVAHEISRLVEDTGARVVVLQDEELKHELEGTLRGNRSSRAEEWRDPEPPADDDPSESR